MQKYKIVASKSQKKYSLIISADSESQARDKIHKEGYSILSSSEASDKEIVGNKFIFQIEDAGTIKNGIIVGKDIFKVYMKLRDELEYHIICLYPEGDDAHTDAAKKQKIMQQLEKGYILQEQSKKNKKGGVAKKDDFYLKKELDKVGKLIQSVIEKLERLINEPSKYNVDKERLGKLQKLYNKLIQIKGSTNLSKLKEIGELALIKVGEIELQSIEFDKNEESTILLDETNSLLKKIGSDQHFIEKDKDIKGMIFDAFGDVKKSLSLSQLKKTFFFKREKAEIDTESYGFLKTVLLLEKYKEKLAFNSKDIRKNIKLFLNPFHTSEKKEKILLTRRVIKQNISILKAKKNGSLSSYTEIRKGYNKVMDDIFTNIEYFQKFLFFSIVLFSLCFFVSIFFTEFLSFNHSGLLFFLFFFFLFFCFSASKNIFMSLVSIVFFLFLFIFFKINF